MMYICNTKKSVHMFFYKQFLVAILQCALVFYPILVQSHDQIGFISIDCGIDVPRYIDTENGFVYNSDANFTEAGENREILASYKVPNVDRQFHNVRSFPQGRRNCYTLEPSKEDGTRYLIRARFMYGNYDNKGEIPVFDLHLGVDLWDTVKIDSDSGITTMEIIHIPSQDYVHVCLVNIDKGIPFISVLELRPMDSHIYLSDETIGSSLRLFDRFDFSSETNQTMRYKDDEYDRLWSPLVAENWKPNLIISNSNEDSITKDDYELPFTVMSNAYTESGGNNINLYWANNITKSTSCLFYMHFAELKKLGGNQSRKFNIYINGDLWSEPFTLEFLKSTTINNQQASKTDDQGNLNVWLNSTDTSTLPPLINALEMYVPIKLLGQETNQNDVKAIGDVKSVYKLERVSWQGDPCAPETYMWDGLNCSSSDNEQPRIVSLKLPSSGLNGTIAPSIASLTMLNHLDLSNNNLNGSIPEFLAQLSSLKELYLQGNDFTGPIPDALLKRSQNGLLLRVDPTRSTQCSSESCGKKEKFCYPTGCSTCWSTFHHLNYSSTGLVDNDDVNNEFNEVDEMFSTKKQQFTFSEIEGITNNFERVIGEGGFGKVYLGFLNGNNVAVKMLSKLSIRGHQQFHTELKLLMRVHHKNLTTLVGYCNEGSNVGLIYEYMAMGNLRSHLSGKNKKVLTWEERLRIARDAAQGLEYLHNGCKPPIVHRDIKSTNILLNEKFEAKLGDFGLSKIFPFESETSTAPGMSASIAGTPGYLDPEYYESNWLNEKSDVYSFGVVLLELITGRAVLDRSRDQNIPHIIHWVSSMLGNGDIKSIIDPKLEGDNFDMNTVWRVIEISMACVSIPSTNRPTMSSLASDLKECLTRDKTRKDDGYTEGEYSKSSDEMISRSGSMSTPIAR
ncbi:putative leucine-rich repeat receptor-like serine/threonine-protein kinase At2g19230 [Humulus lupulus]|uniref:putative leucine-rich repeat receptor-like serine/threonine-protein kinase At2g19230 n=1 Tax=Humulus lupulus TaxID=3486 RepID=UPI002B405E45|nr:putative leucine-rich repeat receptor-like serine/threonine-protein kinase At2g19230 [Humulus lupulus]